MSRALRRLTKRLLFWTKTRRDEERLRLEIEEHVAMETEENLRSGMDFVESRRRAMVKFGGVEGMKEIFRETRGLPFLETLVADVRHALRRLRKAKAFTATTILTLALGIGATTSIFTLVHAVLLKSLEVAKPSELMRFGQRTHCCVWGGYTQYGEFSVFSEELYHHFRKNSPEFVELAAMQAGGGALFGVRQASSSEIASSYPGKYVSGNYFAMFGIHAVAGRLLTNEDDSASAPPVTAMSYRLWQQKYGSDPKIIGKTFNLNEKPFTLVGILPAEFHGDTLGNIPPDFYLPLATEPMVRGDASILKSARSHWLDLIGRVKPGTNTTALEAKLRVEMHQWLASHWADMDDNERANEPTQKFYLSAGGAGITSMREQYEHWLQILMMVAGFVLLIVCANVANLMLVRGIARRGQISLSIALGASPGRLMREALTESLVLSLMGGLAGIAVAYAGTTMILHYAFTPVAGMASVPISAAPSLEILFFALGVSLLTGAIFGIAPAWMATRVDPIESLRGANRSTGKSGSLPRKILVVAQAALALALLCSSGLLTAALGKLEHQDFGFEQDNRMIVAFDPQLAGYRAEQLTQLYRKMQEAFTRRPDVERAVVCSYSPLSGDNWNDGIFVNGHPAPGPQDDNGAGFDRVGPYFLSAIGNQVLRGREITDKDVDSAPHVAVINEAFVKKFFPNEDPMGKHIGRSEIGASNLYEIVGVAKNARVSSNDIGEPIGAFMYVPQEQYDVFPTEEHTKGDIRSHYLNNLVVQLKPGARLSQAEATRTMASVDPNLPIYQYQSLREQVAGQFTQERLIARLTSLFGLLSLVLASIGLYGVTAYNAGQRTNEIGLRMALGANRGNVIALVLRGALGLIAVGLVLGIPLSILAGHFLGSQLFGMSPFDVKITVIALGVLGTAGFVAALIPALRASAIEPLKALRVE